MEIRVNSRTSLLSPEAHIASFHGVALLGVAVFST